MVVGLPAIAHRLGDRGRAPRSEWNADGVSRLLDSVSPAHVSVRHRAVALHLGEVSRTSAGSTVDGTRSAAPSAANVDRRNSVRADLRVVLVGIAPLLWAAGCVLAGTVGD